MSHCTAFFTCGATKQKTSVGERKTENRHTKRDIEVSHDFCHIQKTSSEEKAEGKTDEWTDTTQGEADRHRFKT